MDREDIIKLAREAGIDAESDTLTRYEGFVEPLTRFATLIVANLDPKSFMSWQEGYEAGKQAEREACAKVCDGLADIHAKMNQWDSHKTAETLAQAIRAGAIHD